ncbi:MAG TPA: Ig-like domain repeat protein [Candidatus Acidoferrales bacterium]
MHRNFSRLLRRTALYFAALLMWVGFPTRYAFAQSATPVLTVDATGNPHPINPDIYGLANYGLDANFAKEIQVPNIRWGGDGTTRYNWMVDSSNAGFDWYFTGGNGQATPVPSASADLMINTYKAASNAHTLLTIPIIPWVNKSAAWNCSFPVSVYGAQQSFNPYIHPNGDNCGNSIATNGTQLMDTNVYANHIDNTVALQQGWVQHLVATFGTAANGGVPYYQLDNEPGGWSNTHRDVEPVQPDYDTIISLGQQYAAVIKVTDPSAKVFGPVDFTLGGWIGTPSKQNNLYAGQYYLQQMAAYDAANHQRILDYFDEHYYGGGSTDALELADTRSLWDPTYNSGTWVEQYYFDGPMNLLPRFRNWIATYYPGTKLSISEYSFAMGTNPLVDMLTETDVLGIYGVQGLDFANMWNVPKPTDPLAYSFRVYRNLDGAGGQFGDTAVNSVSTDQGQLSVYGALRSSDGALTVVAINKTTGAIQTSLALTNFNAISTAAVYTYSNANLAAIVAGSPVSVASNSVSYNFPAYSVTVFVFTPASATLAASTTSLGASATQVTAGQSVIFTATVAASGGGSGTPSGTVTFSDGATQIGTGTLSSGIATFSTSTLASGSHSITAAYAGDSSFSASTSAAVGVSVSAATPPTKTATTTTVSPSATQLTTGQTLTLTIHVAPNSGSGTPTGTLTLFDGATQISSPALVAGAASYNSSTLAAGNHSFTVNYSGDANFAASVSAAVAVTVSAAAKIATTTSVSASATQITAGQSVTFTATVAPASGSTTPTGTVTFYDNASLAGTQTLSGGVAQFSTASLTTGAHAITASYSGDANNSASTSVAVNVTVGAAAAADFTMSMSSGTLSVAAGSSGNLTVTVTPENGFKQPVTFTCAGLPSGATCMFSPTSVTPSGAPASSTLTVQAPAAAGAISPGAVSANGVAQIGGAGFSGGANALAAASAAANSLPAPRVATLSTFALAFFGMFGIFAIAQKQKQQQGPQGQRHAHAFARCANVAPTLLASAAIAAMLVTASCAGYITQKTPTPTSTNYTVTVIAASGSLSHSSQFTLTVTQ